MHLADALLLYLCLTVHVLNALCAQIPDPCLPGNHVELNEPYRSTGFETDLPHKPLCDLELKPNWYRFTSKAGGEMPTTCPQKKQCGTYVPIWLNGVHPSVAEGIVIREACGSFFSGGPQKNPCCDQSLDIYVKNCGRFYVYYLFPTPACPVSYCAGNVAPCPVGKWSPTLFPPCKDAYPVIKTPPTLRGPNVRGKSFHFQCEFTYVQQDPDQVFEVVWTFDGQEDPKIAAQKLTDPDRTAVFDGSLLQGHLNSNLECQVRSYYKQNQAQASEYLKSNAYFAGIQFEPPKLVVSEGELSKNLIVTSTIPIICEDNRPKCCLTYRLDVDADRQVSVANSCNYEMCSTDWDDATDTCTIEVPVIANQDMITDGNKQLLLTFESLLPVAGGPYLDVFASHELSQIQVVVEDQQTSTCWATGDPHFKGFDFQTYHLYKIGDFTVYEVPSRHFQIQIRTWACWSVTCICGIVIREKNDVIRIDQCDQIIGGAHTSPTVETGRVPLRQGTVIQRSATGRTIAVYLRSGVEVKVDCDTVYFNVYITGPGTDQGKARGLCGTNDGIQNNDFTRPDGIIYPVCENHNCIPDAFLESWRVTGTASLFVNLPPKVKDDDEVKYCVCSDKTKVVNCDIRAKVPSSGILCPGCPQLNALGLPQLNGHWKRNKRDLQYADFDDFDVSYEESQRQIQLPVADPNKQWPNNQGVTEGQARDMCTKAIQRSQLNSKCGSMNNRTEMSMIDCMSDILYGGTTAFLDAITSAFTTSCQLALARDPANWVTNAEGKQIMKPEYLDDICDLECEKHGRCGEKGVCVCDSGWEGKDCHIQSGKGPQMDRIRSGTLCDKATRPCKAIYIDVTNINMSDDLICKVQLVDEQGNDVGTAVNTEAGFVNAYRIACSLPDTTVASQRYKVSASNDGSLFGNELSLRVFDSACLDCTDTGCTPKKNEVTVYDEKNNVCVSKSTECKTGYQADIVFLLDSSASLGDENYKAQLTYAAKITQNFVIGPKNVRFGAVVFGSEAQKLFDLMDYADDSELSNAILSAPYLKSGTNTAEALNLVNDQDMFGDQTGDRNGAAKIVIVLTDGLSDSKAATVLAAQRLKDAGVSLISVDPLGTADLDGLRASASRPQDVFKDSISDVLNRIQAIAPKQTCGSN